MCCETVKRAVRPREMYISWRQPVTFPKAAAANGWIVLGTVCVTCIHICMYIRMDQTAPAPTTKAIINGNDRLLLLSTPNDVHVINSISLEPMKHDDYLFFFLTVCNG